MTEQVVQLVSEWVSEWVAYGAFALFEIQRLQRRAKEKNTRRSWVKDE